MLNNNLQTQMMLEQMKQEIAAEFGVELNGDSTSRALGSVGGEITKRLIELGKMKLMEMSQEQVIINNQMSYHLSNSNTQPQPQNINNQIH